MSFYEGQFPYVNQHGLNLDWLLKTVKEHEERIKTLEDQMADVISRLEVVEGSIVEINNRIDFLYNKVSEIEYDVSIIKGDIIEIREDITSINEQIEIINNIIQELDIDTIMALINRYNHESIVRDEDLSRRIALLEQAVLHDVYNYIGYENLILWGSDFRNIPDEALDDYGFPIGMAAGNTEGASSSSSCIKYTKYGFTDNDQGTGYTYLTLGKINELPHASDNLTQPLCVTLGIANSTSFSVAPTEVVIGITELNENYAISGMTGVSLRLDYNQNDDYFTLDIRGTASNMHAAFTGKYLTYCRMEYGLVSAGIRYNNVYSTMSKLLGQMGDYVTPSEVKQIVKDNLEQIIDTETYEEEYSVTLVPKDGSASYSVPAKIDVRLQKTVGYISGMVAINIPFTEPTKYVDFTKTFELTLDTTDLDIPKKTILADTIHAFTDLFTGAQFNVVLNNGDGMSMQSPSNQICSIRLWGAMKPITLDNNGHDFCTLGVIKVFEPCDWELTPPV